MSNDGLYFGFQTKMQITKLRQMVNLELTYHDNAGSFSKIDSITTYK